MSNKHKTLHPIVGKTFFVGDLHGRHDVFIRALVHKGFNHKIDRVICVGDLIDKGKQSYQCLSLLRRKWFFSVMGNHEEMLVDEYRTGYTQQAWFNELGDDQQDNAIELILGHMPLSYTVKIENGVQIGVVHAHPPINGWAVDWRSLKQQGVENFLWKRVRHGVVPDQIIGVNALVFGHNNVARATKFGASLCIDTLIDSGSLTILEAGEVLNAMSSTS